MYLLPENSLTALDTVHCMDAMAFLRGLPSNYVNCIVTSPPYWNLRNYGVAGQMGLEDTPQAFVKRMTALFREARRVLRSDGTCWVNLGDSYNGGDTHHGTKNTGLSKSDERAGFERTTNAPDLKPKDLCGIPFRVALALQDDGWYLRSDIIWHKPNPMPESVTDRPTKAHEYLFLLTKSAKYWYDADAIRERQDPSSLERLKRGWNGDGMRGYPNGPQNHIKDYMGKSQAKIDALPGRNKRTVWTVPTQPYSAAHFATYPMALIDPCIKAGCPPKVCAECGMPWEWVTELTPEYKAVKERLKESLGSNFHMKRSGFNAIKGKGTGSNPATLPPKNVTIGWQPTCQCNAATRPGIVLDMFMGAGTTALVSIQNNRHYIGSELNPEYVAMARQRIAEFDRTNPSPTATAQRNCHYLPMETVKRCLIYANHQC